MKPLQTSLLKELTFLFPITKVDDNSNSLTFSILGQSISENVLKSDCSSALGYTSLVVKLLSLYLNVHLPYQVIYKGSQSMIIDNISNIRGSNVFPLHLNIKKDQIFRFEYANFILNKNIEMVRHVLLNESDNR